MITRGIREYMARDWAAVRAGKDRYWAERIARLGPLEGWRVGDELRRYALKLHPHWPTPEQRQEDFAAHLRLAEKLRRAGPAVCR